jgi:two-component system osmolarity sensor histidine kinase EnvZ
MLGGVSHDLRTPLTRLRLSLEMIRGDDELRNVAVRQVDRIEAMLGQFLDFARGFESETIARTDLAPLLRQVVADCGATDSATISLGDNIVIRTRPHALARAVANLLGNALRHGAAPISLTARIEGDRLGIMVRDAGPGLSADQADAMLRPFARGDSARGGDGAGLGLAIADRAVRAIGGRLHFARDSEGFAVMIDLPLAIDN